MRRLAALATLLMLAGGCTPTQPDPVPSTPEPVTPTATPTSTAPAPGQVAVVVSPSSPVGTEDAVRDVLGAALDEDDLRVVTADSPGFIPDLATLLTTQGYELVCAVGAGAQQAIRQVASQFPSTRYCVAPSRPDGMPGNVLAIDLRVEELGYLAGVAVAADDVAGPAGLVTSLTTWAPQRLRAGMSAGLSAGGARGTVLAVGPVSEPEVAAEQANELLANNVGGILAWTGPLDATILDVVASTPITRPPPPVSPTPTLAPTTPPTEAPDEFASLVAGPAVRPTEDAEPATVVLAVLELHLEEAVAVALARHVDRWETSPTSVGLAQDAFQIDVGGGPRAATVAQAVEAAADRIRAGDVEIPTG